MNNLDRSIADNLQINARPAVWARNQFAAACDACLMSELSLMTPEQRRRHADWFSTGPVDGTVLHRGELVEAK
jgi:hypothetical protein